MKRIFSFILCISIAAFSIAVGLYLSQNRNAKTKTPLQYIEASPATRMEYQTDDGIRLCTVYSDSKINTAFSSLLLENTTDDIDTTQWIFRITYYIDEVSSNTPEIVCLVGNDWVSIDGTVYILNDTATANWLTEYLTSTFQFYHTMYGSKLQQ